MRKFLPVIISIIFSVPVFSATGDTTTIVAHSLSNLNSPPSDDDVWVVFPNTAASYQKIIMKFTLGCGQPNCSGWDYTVNTLLGKKNGRLDSTIVSIDTLTLDTTWSYSDQVEFIEIGRLITPYGTYMAAGSNGFNNSWTHPYYYDITDYAAFLKDSVNVRVHYDGWTDAFSAKIEFLFIEGPRNREVESVQEIYHTYIGYPNSAGFENVAVPKTFTVAPNVTSAKVVLIMTGHGSQGEFDPHFFHIMINGVERYSRMLWKSDCDVNPIAPQGGTWIFHRANWCPGDKVPVFEADITPYITPGQNVTIDLDFDDYMIQSGQSAGYGVSAYLITYTAQKNNDVMLEEIIAPNADKPYLHWNPVCTSPKVKIKNTGKQNLTYAEISYWIKDGQKWYFEWTGFLPPFESQEITLPAFDWNGLDTTDKIFYAEAKWPNNVPDEYSYNDLLQSEFKMTPVLDSVFYIFFRTNNHPEENWYVVRNEDGDTITFKNTFAASTSYRDTLYLAPGSYAFDMFDFDNVNWGCGDGVSWWLNTQNGLETTGQFSLRKLNNTIIKNFTGDFGGNTHYEFTVGFPLGFNAPKTAPTPPVHNTSAGNFSFNTGMMNIFPNPANNFVNVEILLPEATDGSLVLTDISGKSLKKIRLEDSNRYSLAIPVQELSRGLYFLNFTSRTASFCRKILLN